MVLFISIAKMGEIRQLNVERNSRVKRAQAWSIKGQMASWAEGCWSGNRAQRLEEHFVALAPYNGTVSQALETDRIPGPSCIMVHYPLFWAPSNFC